MVNIDDGRNLPIPNRERNNGGTMEVYHYQQQLPGTHPWRRLPSEDDDEPGRLESQSRNADPAEHKFFNLSIPVFALSCALLLVTAALIIASGLLGSKISHLEKSIPSLALAAINNNTTTTSNPANNTPNSDNNTTTTNNSSAAKTTPTPPTILVSGWTYLGCFYDGEVRLLPDAFTSRDNMTNAACGELCTSTTTAKARNFGTQHGTQCFCGSVSDAALASHAAPEWMCNQQCKGRWGVAENCGGNWASSVWEREGS